MNELKNSCVSLHIVTEQYHISLQKHGICIKILQFSVTHFHFGVALPMMRLQFDDFSMIFPLDQ